MLSFEIDLIETRCPGSRRWIAARTRGWANLGELSNHESDHWLPITVASILAQSLRGPIVCQPRPGSEEGRARSARLIWAYPPRLHELCAPDQLQDTLATVACT